MADPNQMKYLFQDFDKMVNEDSKQKQSQQHYQQEPNPIEFQSRNMNVYSDKVQTQAQYKPTRGLWSQPQEKMIQDYKPAPLDWGVTIEQELEFFLKEDEEDPLKDQIEEAKEKAREFMQVLKNKFPNRYFILKRISQNNDFWQTCCVERSYVIITDESNAKKLQNCYEISDNVFLVFVSVEQRLFLGFGKVVSEVFNSMEVPELSDVPILQQGGTSYACKMQWMSKNSIGFDYVKHIRNSHNNNNSINMCKEFNEVDDMAAKLLLAILEDPSSAPNPKTNPFMPVGPNNDVPGMYNPYAMNNRFLAPFRNFFDMFVPTDKDGTNKDNNRSDSGSENSEIDTRRKSRRYRDNKWRSRRNTGRSSSSSKSNKRNHKRKNFSKERSREIGRRRRRRFKRSSSKSRSDTRTMNRRRHRRRRSRPSKKDKRRRRRRRRSDSSKNNRRRQRRSNSSDNKPNGQHGGEQSYKEESRSRDDN